MANKLRDWAKRCKLFTIPLTSHVLVNMKIPQIVGRQDFPIGTLLAILDLMIRVHKLLRYLCVPAENSPLRLQKSIADPHVPPNRGLANRRPQIEHITCGVVELPDHHCGDDIVELCCC